QVFPSVLESRLKAMGIECQVLNASRAGSSISGHVRRARLEGASWRPHVAVLYQMSNDINAASRGRIPADEPDAPVDDNEPKAAGIGHVLGFDVSRALEQTTLYSVVKTNLTSKLVHARVLRAGLGVGARDDFLREVHRWVDRWGEAGALPVITTFAMSRTRAQAATLPADHIRALLRSNIHLSVDGWGRTIDEWNEGLRGVAAERAVPLVDLYPTIAGRAPYFRDYVHFTAEGHEAMAEALAEELAPLLRGLEGNR
ncbi:MAG: SGNH/GDSL hydrolase family protein, partial [Planctomycetota bacterium]